MRPGALEVTLISAEGIKNVDLFGKADPYAIVKCKGQSFRSKTAKDQGSDPVWNDKFVFDLDGKNDGEATAEQLFVKLYDEDSVVGSDDFIGTVRVPLADVFDGEKHEGSYNVILPGGKTKGKVKLAMNFEPRG